MLKTTGWISLANRTPESVAELIIKKLRDAGVELDSDFSYSDDAKADVDFPTPRGTEFSKIVEELKSHTWPRQAPAVSSVFELDWETLDKNQIFVLGRNIYQCACGSERTAFSILVNLRGKLAGLPDSAAIHLLNGMFFEVYFDKEGKFRGDKIKDTCLKHLLEAQNVKRLAASIFFIRRELLPYSEQLPYIPSTPPEVVSFEVVTRKSDPLLIKSLTLAGQELLARDDNDYFPGWKTISAPKFTVQQLKSKISEKWKIPDDQIEIQSGNGLDSKAEYRLPDGHVIKWPERRSRQ